MVNNISEKQRSEAQRVEFEKYAKKKLALVLLGIAEEIKAPLLRSFFRDNETVVGLMMEALFAYPEKFDPLTKNLSEIGLRLMMMTEAKTNARAYDLEEIRATDPSNSGNRPLTKQEQRVAQFTYLVGYAIRHPKKG